MSCPNSFCQDCTCNSTAGNCIKCPYGWYGPYCDEPCDEYRCDYICQGQECVDWEITAGAKATATPALMTIITVVMLNWIMSIVTG